MRAGRYDSREHLIKVWAAILLLLIATSGCAVIPITGSTEETGWEIRQETYEFQGEQVAYEIRVPEGYQPGWLLPLIISLNEPHMTAQEQEDLTGLAEKAAGTEYFILYPQPVDGQAEWRYGAEGGESEDLDFLLALLDHLKVIWDMDANRVYLVGMGSGAEFAYALACHEASEFVAAALVAGRYLEDLPCSPSDPLSIFLVHGEEDTVMPYGGGAGYLPVPGVFQKWAALNECSDRPSPLYQRGPVSAESRANCKDDTEVLLFTLSDEGHSWPTRPDFHTTELVWQFFQAH